MVLIAWWTATPPAWPPVAKTLVSTASSAIPRIIRKANGTFADCVVAFVREHQGQWVAVIVPRLSSRIGFPPIGERWQDTAVELPESFFRQGAKDIFTGKELCADGSMIQAGYLMAQLPFAAYSNAPFAP